MNEVLLTVSGEIAPDIETQIAQGQRPLADYVAMGEAFGADLLDYNAARRKSGRFGALLEHLGGPNLLLAWACYLERRRYKVIFTDGEQVGLPLAFLLKFLSKGVRPRHLMIAHILSTRFKKLLLDLFRLYTHIDFFFTYSNWQKHFIVKRWVLPIERVVLTPFMVDADFFSPAAAETAVIPDLALNLNGKPLICSVGLEFRDYPTLIEAVRGMDLQLVVAAASPWSKRADTTAGEDIPENVVVRGFSQYELRELYRLSRFMVMPLYYVAFQAGVTAILEAMAMQKPIVCSRTPGQTDVIMDGQNGLYVTPQNTVELRAAIERLLEDESEVSRMGLNARKQIEQEMSLERYVSRLNRYVRQAVEG